MFRLFLFVGLGVFSGAAFHPLNAQVDFNESATFEWGGLGSRPAKAVAISVNEQDNPVVAFSTGQDEFPFGTFPRIASGNGQGEFTVQELPLYKDSDQYTFWNMALAVDSAGAHHLAAHVSTGSTSQQIIYYTDKSGSWTVEKAMDFGPESESLDILLDEEENVHIMGSYGGFNIQFGLKHAILEAGGWTINDAVEPGSAILSGAFMGQHPDGSIGFVFYHGGPLKYGEWTGGDSYTITQLQSNSSREEWPYTVDTKGRGYIFGGGGWLWFQDSPDAEWDAYKVVSGSFSRQIEVDPDGTIHLLNVSGDMLQYTTATTEEAQAWTQITSGAKNRYARMALADSGTLYVAANLTGNLNVYRISGGGGGPVSDSYWGAIAEATEGAKQTNIGWLDDREWPFVFHYGLGAWLYILEPYSSVDAFYAYVYAGDYWIWSSDAYGGWYVDMRDYSWTRFF